MVTVLFPVFKVIAGGLKVPVFLVTDPYIFPARWILDTLPNTDLFLISAYNNQVSLPKDPRITVIEKPLSLKSIAKLIT